MLSFRCLLLQTTVLSCALFALGCSSPEVVVEEAPKVSWVGKKVVVKHFKTKRFLFTPKGEIRPAGDLSGYTGVVKSEQTKEDGDYALVRVGREDYWVKSEDVVIFDEADAYFDKMLEESPRSYEPRVLRAAVQMDSGRPEKALEDLGEAHRIKSNIHYPLTVRAQAYVMLGEYVKALEDYETVLKFDQNNLGVFLGRAKVLHALGRTELALYDVDRAIKYDPKCVQAYLQRALLWEFKKEDAAALVDYEKASHIDQNDPGIPTARGEYWLRKKDYVKANDDFEAALKIESEHAPALIGKAIILSQAKNSSLRDPKRAVDLAHKACDLTGWKDYAAIEVLGVAHAAAGNYQEATKYVRQALDDPLYNKTHGDVARKHLVLFQNNLPLSFE